MKEGFDKMFDSMINTKDINKMNIIELNKLNLF